MLIELMVLTLQAGWCIEGSLLELCLSAALAGVAFLLLPFTVLSAYMSVKHQLHFMSVKHAVLLTINHIIPFILLPRRVYLSIAAAAIYMASQASDVKKTQKGQYKGDHP